jgi:signal transduction histidine kinase
VRLSLRVKLTGAFLAITLFLIAAVGVAANLLLENQFREYVIQDQKRKNEELVSLLQSRYESWGSWNKSGLESIGVNVLSEGLMLRIKDSGGHVIWDAMVHNMGFCSAMLEDMAKKMQSVNPGFKGGYTEQSFSLTSRGIGIGTVDIGYYGPYFYNDNDIRYLNALNDLLIWTAFACALFAMLFGTGLARHLTRPIRRVIASAKKISEGDYRDRIRDKTGTTEIKELTDSINSLAESLEAQDKLRKRLTGDVAHELRTPLATLQSHLEAMIDGVWEPDSSRLKSCHEEIVRLNKLVGDLGKLERYDSEKITLTKTRFDLAALIRRSATNFESGFMEKGIRLRYFAEPLEITADEDKISQVIVNLLSNAGKFTGSGGSVDILAGLKQGKAEITVIDTGTGISEQDLPHIFERFYRADPSRSRVTGGSGIGLAIAKSIVLAHNGTIGVKSEYGRGTTFTVTLPI